GASRSRSSAAPTHSARRARSTRSTAPPRRGALRRSYPPRSCRERQSHSSCLRARCGGRRGGLGLRRHRARRHGPRLGPRSRHEPVGRPGVRGARRHNPRTRVVAVPLKLEPPLVFDCPAAPLSWNGRAYHGLLVVRRSGGRLSVINSLLLDDYVRGVVGGEMPHGWRLAALEAQAVAARSYAIATLKPGAHFDLYPDTRSQVYGGVAFETPRTSLAVQRTAGRVLTWNGRVATTFFFSTSGGRTADVRDVWPRAAPAPYLRSVPDPYDAGSPHHVWGPLVLSEQRVAALLHAQPGGNLRIVRNASGRVAWLVLGGKRIDGNGFRRALGLSS